MVTRVLVHSVGDVVLVMAADGHIRGHRVATDGGMAAVDPAGADVLRVAVEAANRLRPPAWTRINCDG